MEGLIAPLIAVYTQNTGQTFSSGVTTVVNYETKQIDTYKAVTTGSAWKYVAPISGVHIINARLLFNASTAWAYGEVAGLYVYHNGIFHLVDRWSDINSPTTAVTRMLRGTYIMRLNVLDTIKIYVNQASGVNLTTTGNYQDNRVEIIAWPEK